MPTGRGGCLHAQARRFPVHVLGISGRCDLNLRLSRVRAAKPALFSGTAVGPVGVGAPGARLFTAGPALARGGGYLRLLSSEGGGV